MADSKITALTALTAADPANDMIPIVDVSDTPPASGNTKRISINNILACSPSATLASATITGDLTVRTNKLAVTSTGVGIGTTTPNAAYILDLTTANDARARQWIADSGFLGSGNLANGYQLRTLGASSDGIKIANYANTVEYLRIDSSGNVGVGVTPSAWSSVYKAVQIGGSGGNGITLAGNDASIGTGYYLSAAGVYNRDNASATASSINMYNRSFIFRTAASGSAGSAITWTDSMTLDASGNLLVGTTGTVVSAISRFRVSAAGAAAVDAKTTLSPDAVADFWNSAIAGDNVFVRFWTEAAATVRGSITYNRGAGQVAYNITSDYRLKEDIKPLTGAINRITSLKPSAYKLKETGSACEGFIAHELAEVVPMAVTGAKDAVDADGKPVYQAVDLSKVTPLLVAAIQELTARVEALEA